MRDRLLQTSEVARLLNVTPDSVRRLERLGKLPAQKTARGVRLFARADVDRVVSERQVERDACGRPSGA
jgi:excisionase family DNA binding protein